ncbi:MAG: cytochrome c3 family protein [Desulfobacterales bacterium]
MKTRSLLIAMVIGAAVVFFAAGIYAATKVEDMVKIQDKGCEYTKGIVEFSHKKHSEDYAKKSPDLYKDKCGTCHHDDKGKPLVDIAAGQEVKRCIECHKKCGEPPKGKDAPKLSDKEKLEYVAQAFHVNCRDCHKAYNKANKTKAAPTTCTKCHPKTK